MMALNSSTLTNAGTTPDWLEIVNTGATSVNLAGWSLSNDGNPRKFVFHNPTTLAAGGYLLVYCDSQTNAPGLHSGFALSGQGEHPAALSDEAIDKEVLRRGPGGVDPIPWIRTLRIPALWVYGGRDRHIPSRLSEVLLRSTAKSMNLPRVLLLRPSPK